MVTKMSILKGYNGIDWDVMAIFPPRMKRITHLSSVTFH